MSVNGHSGIFGTQWFHQRFALAADGQYATVTEVADWARAPYDDLCKRLLLGRNGRGPRVMMLAPVRHGDGTTTTAIMLGATLATGARTLVLDLNFRRPGLAPAVGLDGHSGLGGALRATEGEAIDRALERAICPTPVANLYALPNEGNGNGKGRPDRHPIDEVIRRLRELFEYVIIDAAPVMGYPDTPLLAPVADAVLLIVAADATPVEECVTARSELERNGAPLLGAVVTRQRRFVPEFLARRFGETA